MYTHICYTLCVVASPLDSITAALVHPHANTQSKNPKIDTREVAAYLVPHVPHLLLVRPFDAANANAGGSDDHTAVPYRVLSSLGALLELLPPEEEGGGGDGAGPGGSG